MAVVVGAFGTRTQAEDAMVRLRDAGFDDSDFSLISNAGNPVGAPQDADQRANTAVDVGTLGAAVGAVIGGALLGPVGAVVGGLAAGGGLAAALEAAGVTREDAAEYEARLRAGRYALIVRANGREQTARALLDLSGAQRIDVER